jgi:hypothetical protein
MSREFEYRPKFFDIRVRPPKKGEDDVVNDVLGLKPGEKRCDHPECRLAGRPRRRSRATCRGHYWFCQQHAAEYNKNWNFYAGMSEGQIRAAQEAER